MSKPKRVGIFADLHCGHRAGLTHPNWFSSGQTDKGMAALTYQREMWKAFTSEVKKRKPFDAAVWNGDLIDGRGERSGGSDIIEPDRTEQVEMAVRVIEFVGAKKNFITLGTRYHAGKLEDWERMIARQVDGDIKAHQFLSVNGLVLDVKHKVAGSTIPHGRLTAPERAKMWNKVWSLREDGQPAADVAIRSHVHYSTQTKTELGVGFTTPALQAAWTDYGARECEGTVDFGFLVFDVTNERSWSWEEVLIPLKAVKQEATIV